MKKHFKGWLAFFVVLLFFCVSSLSVLGADREITAVSESEFDNQVNYIADSYASQLENSAASGLEISAGDGISLMSDASPNSFVPTLTIRGTEYAYGSTTPVYFSIAEQSTSVSYESNTTSPETRSIAFSLSQINSVGFDYVLSGFREDSTYNGVMSLAISVPKGQQSSAFSWDFPGGLTTTSAGITKTLCADIFPTTVTCSAASSNDVPVYYSRSTSSDNNWINFTFYIFLNDLYIPESNNVTSVNSVVLHIDWSVATQVKYYLNGIAQGVNPHPAAYYQVVVSPYVFQTRNFSGTRISGQSTFDSQYSESIADKQNELQESIADRQEALQESIAAEQAALQESIANEQASLSESQQDELLNGYDNSSGDAAIDSGNDAVESAAQNEGDALESAADLVNDYEYDENVLHSLSSAFRLISDWYMGLIEAMGGFDALIYVSIALVVALFAIGYFRNG